MVLIDLVTISRNLIIQKLVGRLFSFQNGPFQVSERFHFRVRISEICPVRHFFTGLWVFSMGQCVLCNWRVQGSWRICSLEYEWWKLEGCCNGNAKIFELFWEGVMTCSAFPPQSWKKTILLWKIMGNREQDVNSAGVFFQRVAKKRCFFDTFDWCDEKWNCLNTVLACLVGYGRLIHHKGFQGDMDQIYPLGLFGT